MELPLIQPRYDKHCVGWCDEQCGQYDGKRCRVLGYSPGAICEPWARQAGAERNKLPPVVREG